jgi:curved DNA-binding protein CbpA
MYNPALLSRLDLPPDADYAAIKARFRQLAKLYHPDHGGDAAQMLALLETFHKLTQT